MLENLKKGFRLGSVEVRPTDNALVAGESTSHIEPKTMAVLLTLASAGSNTVSREELVSNVWPRGHVTDDVLNRCISQLRTALEDDTKSPSYIATVPRQGYRLLANVESLHHDAPNGILVLPFQNLAAHGQDEYLADGLTELLIARLAVAIDQRVISRTTAMAYKDSVPTMNAIHERLGVKWVVEGSLLQLGEQLQVVVQLIDAEADAHAWAETWARPAEDIMSVLNEISRQVSTQINARLEEPAAIMVKADALPDELMRRYLQGMHHASKRAAPSLRQAVVCFQEVLDEHPDHAPALAGMAMCHMLLVHYGAELAAESIPKARAFSQRALAIDPGNADAMSHLGAVHFFHDWDFESAGELAHAALEIKPNLEMALILAANVNLVNGQYEKSQRQVDRAIAIDPLNIGILMNAGDILILQRRYGEAIRSLSQALELSPRFRPAWLRLALAHALQGQQDEAQETLQKAKDLSEEDAVYWEYRALIAGQARNQAEAVKSATALQQMAENGESVLPWSLARAWAAAGECDKAITFLEKAYDAHSSSIPFLGQTPMFNTIRDRSEIQELMKRIGLPF